MVNNASFFCLCTPRKTTTIRQFFEVSLSLWLPPFKRFCIWLSNIVLVHPIEMTLWLWMWHDLIEVHKIMNNARCLYVSKSHLLVLWRHFWIRQELKEWQCLSVCPSHKLSRPLNLSGQSQSLFVVQMEPKILRLVAPLFLISPCLRSLLRSV